MSFFADQLSSRVYQKTVESAFRDVADALTNVEKTTASEEDLKTRVAAARDAFEPCPDSI